MEHLILILILFGDTFATQKVYEVTKCDNCKGVQPILGTVSINNGIVTPNKIYFSGLLEVLEKVPGPLEFSFDANRCDFSMKKCEKFTVMKASGICEIFQSKSGMFTEALRSFKPRITCPLMPGKYYTNDSILDVSPISVLPSDGFVWVVTVKAVSGDGKNKKLALCLQVEVKITKVREVRKKKN